MADFVGKRILLKDMEDYVKGLEFDKFKPKLIVVHHTAIPNLSQRPDGLTLQHMKNLWNFYTVKNKWSGGPHFFVDNKGIWIMQDINQRGVHAVSFNRNGIGIEMLGNYDLQSDFDNPRGKLIRIYTQRLVASLLDNLDLDLDDVRFHRDDKLTKKLCPGKLIDKTSFVNEVSRYRKK